MKKTNKQHNQTEVVFIMDRSGSMSGFEQATISGYNEMLEKQQKMESNAYLTTVLFNDTERILHDRIPLRGVRSITAEEYETDGCTALLDAMGHTIERIADVQKYTTEAERSNHVIFIIITDGYENSSQLYSYKKIHRLVNQAKEKGWEFIFMGANMNAIAEASRFGIEESRAVTYCQDEEGIKETFAGACCLMSKMEQDIELDASWKKDIEEYTKKKAKKK